LKEGSGRKQFNPLPKKNNMENKIEKIICTDVNQTFGEEVSLWKYIGQSKAVETLQVALLQYTNDKSEGKTVKPPSLLISGESGLGSETLARAFSNSICNHFRCLLGEVIWWDAQAFESFVDEPLDTTFYIKSADRLRPLGQEVVYRILKDDVLLMHNRFGGRTEKIAYPRRLIALAATNKGKLIPSLNSAIDIKIKLQKYTDEEIYRIVQQRIKFLGWKTESNKILEIIASKSEGNAGKAIKELLQMSYTVMRSEGRDVIKLRHVNKAIELLGV